MISGREAFRQGGHNPGQETAISLVFGGILMFIVDPLFSDGIKEIFRRYIDQITTCAPAILAWVFLPD
jgi:hypothetical protein